MRKCDHGDYAYADGSIHGYVHCELSKYDWCQYLHHEDRCPDFLPMGAPHGQTRTRRVKKRRKDGIEQHYWVKY